MPVSNELLSKTSRTLSTSAAREGSELAHGEVAGECRHDVEKASLALGIAKLLDALKVKSGNLHCGESPLSLASVEARSGLRGSIDVPGQRSSSPKPVARPNVPGAIAPCSGFLTRARRAVSRPSTAPGGAPACIGCTRLKGGKFGENFPSLIKRLCAREK